MDIMQLVMQEQINQKMRRECKDVSGTDVNNLTPGFFSGNALTNAPNANFFIIMHMEFPDQSGKRQVAYRSSPSAYDEVYTRVYSGSAWQPWRQMVNGRVIQTATIASAGTKDFLIGSADSVVQVTYLDGTVWRTLGSTTQIDVYWVSSSVGWRVKNNSANSYSFKIVCIG